MKPDLNAASWDVRREMERSPPLEPLAALPAPDVLYGDRRPTLDAYRQPLPGFGVIVFKCPCGGKHVVLERQAHYYIPDCSYGPFRIVARPEPGRHTP
jgi:hypothetical protein